MEESEELDLDNIEKKEQTVFLIGIPKPLIVEIFKNLPVKVNIFPFKKNKLK